MWQAVLDSKCFSWKHRNLDLKRHENISGESVNKLEVLRDGGASHNVFYSAQVPEGAVQKEIELAHGT